MALPESLHVVVAGASGFLGTHLTDALGERGHRVTRLVRRTPQGDDESQWDPYAGTLDRDLLGSADVVVNLAGSPLMGNPHSGRWARELEESRVTSTRVLAEAVGEGQAFLAGNAIGRYGDHGAQVVTEDTEPTGDALLTRVTRVWEEAAAPAVEAGARVCVLRTAPVLDRAAPPLQQLRLLFKAGLGGRLGNGRQYFPVISLRDWVGAVVFLAEHESASGPFNLTVPVAPTNKEFTRALARAVHRPAFVAVPAPLLKVAAGPLSPEVLGSVNARPEALGETGFVFHDGDIAEVLRAALG